MKLFVIEVVKTCFYFFTFAWLIAGMLILILDREFVKYHPWFSEEFHLPMLFCSAVFCFIYLFLEGIWGSMKEQNETEQ